MSFLIENDIFSLCLGKNAVAKSLRLKQTDEELLATDSEIPFFSVTQERPYNNEIKLIHLNKETEFLANRVSMENGKLIVGFDVAPYEAVVEINIAPTYIAFTLEGFRVAPEHYGGILTDTPPVLSFKIVSLPIREKTYFGEWLNVAWDEQSAVCLLSTSPHTEIDSKKHGGTRFLIADAHRDILMQGCTAALIVSEKDKLMSAIADVEAAYDLPRGVESRNNTDKINASIYWTEDITPENVDEHIANAKRAGFRMMLIYYTALLKTDGFGGLLGDYDLRDEYNGKIENLRLMLDKIKAAGITPGFHFLHTYIGLKSRYVTPVADHRLLLKRHLTLAAPIGIEDTEIYIVQNPINCPKAYAHTRVLQLGGEMITYEGYTDSAPYKFIGCKRGAFHTAVTEHKAGEIGGIPEISEFGFECAYLDQNSDLQDEIAQKLARIYNAGFAFAYFDGSEGTNAPFAFHIANAQYRVYKAFDKAPIFCEGAAKTHFSWHILSGANAFDVFKTDIFKSMIDAHPVHEAPLMQRNFTRLNFGWWDYFEDTRPDIYEYGMSRAAAWDCPATMMAKLNNFKKNPRTDDNFEVLRRWEDVRARGWLTEKQKEMMRCGQEHILLINGDGEYELLPYDQIEGTPEGLYAFTFTRRDRNYAVYWYQGEEKNFSVPITELVCEEEIDGKHTVVLESNGCTVLPASHRRYASTLKNKATLEEAFRNAVVIEDASK